ncbi:MAG: hypothetical protein QNJ11_08710 [Woeseiaceae bacterium]|nr:hypothetical protein [Woeseiaceae bacterium]
MDNPENPQAPSQGGHLPDRSRLEKVLTKSPHWKRQVLRGNGADAEPTQSDAEKDGSKTALLALRLSAQLDERNEEIERLRHAVSKLETEKSKLDLAHRREVEIHRAELARLQDAYDQFEKESDRLLFQLDQQNERLMSECRDRNVRSLLDT